MIGRKMADSTWLRSRWECRFSIWLYHFNRCISPGLRLGVTGKQYSHAFQSLHFYPGQVEFDPVPYDLHVHANLSCGCSSLYFSFSPLIVGSKVKTEQRAYSIRKVKPQGRSVEPFFHPSSYNRAGNFQLRQAGTSPCSLPQDNHLSGEHLTTCQHLVDV